LKLLSIADVKIPRGQAMLGRRPGKGVTLLDYRFGKHEDLTCIVDVTYKADGDEALCLAYKTMTYSVVAPAYFEDQGYVLAVKNGLSGYYPLPSGPHLEALQVAGEIPKPLPAYSIPPSEYASGYLLWLILAAVAILAIVQKKIKKHRKASLETELPPETGPLRLRTKTDRWLDEEASKLLESGETIEQQAYGNDVEEPGLSGGGKGLYLVLTNRRLLVIEVRVGAFGPLRENRGVRIFERDEIERVDADERHLSFVLKDGQIFEFFAQWRERHLSNQRRFLSDVPRLFKLSQA
jgi:hypothetical protein